MSRDFFGSLPIVDGMGYSRGIMVLDDCEGTCTWIISGTGGDDVHEYSTVAAWQGEKGLRLKTRTTSTAADDQVTVQKIFHHPESGLLLIRLRVTTPTVANCKAIAIGLRDDDGAQQYLADVAIYPSTSLVKYLNSAGSWTSIAALAQTFAASNWYTIELAIDTRTHKFIHLKFNGATADLSDQDMYNDAATAAKAAQALIMVVASAAGPGEAYLDNIYVGEYLDA